LGHHHCWHHCLREFQPFHLFLGNKHFSFILNIVQH
jgi:hypothetical protein